MLFMEPCNVVYCISLTLIRILQWFGEAEKYVKAVFTLASKISPSVIFIDEVRWNKDLGMHLESHK